MADTAKRGPLVTVLVVLLLASAAAFAVGVTFERTQLRSETITGQNHTDTTGTTGDGDSGEPASAAPESSPQGSEASSEALLGVDPESPVTVVVVVLGSVLLAAVVWWRPTAPVLVLTVVVCLAGAAIDAREIVHQIHENRLGLVALATVVLLLHLGAGLVAIAAVREARRLLRAR